MEKKIPWLKIATAAAIVATAAVGIALFVKKKLDELKLREECELFDDECEFYDSYNPMDEIVIKEDEDEEDDKKADSTKEETVQDIIKNVVDNAESSKEEREI